MTLCILKCDPSATRCVSVVTFARNPNCPSMRVETMSMSVTSVFSTMDVMRTSLISLFLEISVPAAFLQFMTCSVKPLRRLPRPFRLFTADWHSSNV